MTAWKTNPDWDKPIPRGELCGRVSDRYTPCPNARPCPTHDVDLKPGGRSPSPSRAPATFTPRLSVFDPWEA